MNRAMLVVVMLMLAPAGAGAGIGGDFLDLTHGNKARFKFLKHVRDDAGMSVSRAPGYFTVKFLGTGFAGSDFRAKETKDVVDLNDWQSLSVDVRVFRKEDVDPLDILVILFPMQEGPVVRWDIRYPRGKLPAGRWVRIVAPVSTLYKAPSKNPSAPEVTGIDMVTCGVWTEARTNKIIETDLRNVRFWKEAVPAITVEVLDR